MSGESEWRERVERESGERVWRENENDNLVPRVGIGGS